MAESRLSEVTTDVLIGYETIALILFQAETSEWKVNQTIIEN